MTTDEAIIQAEEWLAFLDRQRERSNKIQALARLAKTGYDGHLIAKRELRNIDKSPLLYSGDNLEPAVKQLIAALKGEK